jgi:hypothetical protein
MSKSYYNKAINLLNKIQLTPELEKELRLFACWCAENDRKYSKDPRIPLAISTAKAYANKEIAWESVNLVKNLCDDDWNKPYVYIPDYVIAGCPAYAATYAIYYAKRKNKKLFFNKLLYLLKV